MRSVLPRPTLAPWWKLIDWRLVAAAGLPLWAFVFGLILAHRPARLAAQATPEHPPAAPASPDNLAPPPREVVVREGEPAVVPLVVPVPVAAEPVVVAAPAAFRLPDTEVAPADRCKTFETRIRFHPGLVEAAEEAKKAKKMMFVLHISGHFEDPGFT
ncbi:MAG TPA: hypothetical protein VKE74_28815 [Gemmataceae bacterium]|nr:hypothetical protein [Gemmataceae bacterium]